MPRGRPKKVETAAYGLGPWAYIPDDRCPVCNIPIGIEGIYMPIEHELPISHRRILCCAVCGRMIAVSRKEASA